MLITRLICIQWMFTQPHHHFCSSKILLFFKFQSNQHFEAIEFVDQLVQENLYIFRINLPCMAFIMPRHLSPVFTVPAGNAWDRIWGPQTRKETFAFSESYRYLKQKRLKTNSTGHRGVIWDGKRSKNFTANRTSRLCLM